jgi:hypothetical protein
MNFHDDDDSTLRLAAWFPANLRKNRTLAVNFGRPKIFERLIGMRFTPKRER